MYGILKGMTVIEGASFVAAPSAGLYLSQMGADVIRFDQIGGGPDFRRWPVTDDGASLYWEGLNKGKRSIAVDLKSPEGRELVTQLITASGVNCGLFLTNYPAAGFLSYDKLKAERDDLIAIRVMGKRDGKPAVDYTVNCAVGYPFMTGPEDLASPVNHVLPAWDLLTGAYAAFTMVSAERHRRLTGQGIEIRIPLDDMAAATLSNLGQLAEVLVSGADRPKTGNAIFGMFGRDFETSDGKRVMLTVVTSKHWSTLTRLLEIEDAAAHIESELGVGFGQDEGARFTHRERLFPLLEEKIGAVSFDEIASKFDAAGIVWGPYRTVREAALDPAMIDANPLFSAVSQPSGLDYPAAGAPGTILDLERNDARPAPVLGKHTEEILLEHLELTQKTIGDLIDRNIVAIA